jgi:hypothetical protein
MANWSKKDSLWGGETIRCTEHDDTLKVRVGDRFRIEKKGGKRTLIPHPDNEGVWKDFHNLDNPIELHKHFPTSYVRAYAMWVTIAANAPPKKFFLVEGETGDIAITDKAVANGGHDDGTASVER